MSSITKTTVINHLTVLFALKGIPLEVCTDNGQHFSTKQWYTFTDKYGFKHTTFSPHYLQSKSFIKSHVCTMKSTLSKAKASRIYVPEALMKPNRYPFALIYQALQRFNTTNPQDSLSLTSDIQFSQILTKFEKLSSNPSNNKIKPITAGRETAKAPPNLHIG